MTAPNDKAAEPEEAFHHELDQIFEVHQEWFINWMQSKGWRDMSIQLPDMQEWQEESIANQRMVLEEMRVAALRAEFNYERAKKNLEQAKKNKELF
jgi:hypothetical protein